MFESSKFNFKFSFNRIFLSFNIEHSQLSVLGEKSNQLLWEK